MVDFTDLYPFRSYWLDLDNARLHYVDEGPRDAPPVVMVHGNPTWSFYYRTLIPGISQMFRVIVPDHIGCGLSDKPQDYSYTLEQHIQNLEYLIAHLDLKDVTLVLHDWGGGIGMGYATRHPANVARFVIFNTSAFFVPAIPWSLMLARSPMLGEILLRGFNVFARGALLWGTAQHARFTPVVRAGYLAPYDNWFNRIAIYRFVQDIPANSYHPTRHTVNEIDKRLILFRDHPMLIIWGARDFVFTVKDFLRGWQERFPQAEVHILEDAGHFVVEDAHERILPLMQTFLSRR
ncbi:MAG: alpha/beta fold hydrolase [Anaerolineae bacterium]|nr:alpha/beta fold hydrolase [Anaerolineae bacterium]